MVRTLSTMLPLGTQAPEFSLPDTNGNRVFLDDFAGKPALVVMFICNHCPFVKHLRAGLAQFGKDYSGKNVAIVAISSNDVVAHPDDSPEMMKLEQQQAGYLFPYLYDASQSVAQAFRAACTPDFFVFDKDRKLAYRGQFDDSRPESGIPVTGADLRQAVDAIVAGKPIPEPQKPSLGCNIKWKTGNEPEYFAS